MQELKALMKVVQGDLRQLYRQQAEENRYYLRECSPYASS